MKILASDLDGTLVRKNVISEDDLNAIKALKIKGHKFIVATGRSFDGVATLTNQFKLPYDYLVLCNGSLVMDKNHKIVYRKSISNQLAMNILNDFLHLSNLYFYLDDGISGYVPEGKCDSSLIDDYCDKIKILKENELLNLSTPFQILSLCPVDKSITVAENIREKILEKYGEWVEVYRNTCFLDIVPKGCSKGEGISMALKDVSYEVNKVYTIGDSFNDLSMFKITKNSYTFHNVEEKVKDNANNYVSYVHECIGDMLKDA